MTTEVYSKGLYSTHLYTKSINCAFDCGEGLATRMGPRCFGIQKLFVSHGHIDHIAGIAPLIGIRSAGFGDKSTPLTIFYPKNSTSMGELISYIRTMRTPSFELAWVPIEPNDEVDIGKNRKVKIFKTDHSQDSVGFTIIEERKKLNPKYKDLKERELKDLKASGEDISVSLPHKLWSYSGDAYRLPLNEIENSDYLYMDSTFLKVEDRDHKTHASLLEAIEIGKEANIKNLICLHISPRYNKLDIKGAQRLLAREFPRAGKIVIPDKLEVIDTQIPLQPQITYACV